jgi:ATP-binding cassette subfamily C protein LapB
MATPPRSEPDTAPAAAPDPDDSLLECLAAVARLHDRPVSVNGLADGLPLDRERVTPELLVRAAESHGFAARVVKRSLRRISNLVLPAILVMRNGGGCVLTRCAPGTGAEVLLPESGMGVRSLSLDELAAEYSGYAIFVQPRLRIDPRMVDDAPPPSRTWFWGTLWRFKRYYVETALAALLANVLALATSLFAMNVYDRVVPNQALSTLWVLATGTAIAIGFEFILRILRSYFIDTVGKKIDLLLASQLFRQALSIQAASRPASAGAMANHVREFESLRDFFTSATLVALFDLPFVALFIWIVHIIGGPLAWVPLLAVPTVLLAGLIAQFPLSRAMNSYVAESSMKHGLLIEAIEGVDTLKALRAEGAMQKRWETFTALTAQTALRSRFISSLVLSCSMLVQQVVTVALIVWGVHLIGTGQLTMGGLVACTILAGRAIAPLSQLAGLLTRFQHARAALKTLNRVMRLPVDRPADRTFVHRPRIDGAVEFKDLTFAYPGQTTPVLHAASFRLAPGEHVAMLGRVGAGKSTTLKLVSGLYAPTTGAALIDGLDLQQIDPSDVRANIAYVSQDVRLFHATLRDNLTLGAPLADDEAILAAARIAGLDRFIASHPQGLDLVVGERGEGLSGGQKQAVAIARALLRPARILLFDEPTSSMDHTTEQAFIAQLKEFSRGRTMLLATHKPAMLDLVERLIVVDGGKIVADGPREVILKALMKPLQAGPAR